jgi:hypothetical protein
VSPCAYNSVVHDLDRDQLELRDLVRNSAINRDDLRVQRGPSGERRATLDLQHSINNSALSTLLSLLLHVAVVNQYTHILVHQEIHLLFRQNTHIPVSLAQVVVLR